MLVFGRLSVRIVLLAGNVAAAAPLLVIFRVQVHGLPSVVAPLTLLVFVTVRSGSWVTVVGSVAVSFAVSVSPPPDTVTLLVTLEAALVATFTVSVMVE